MKTTPRGLANGKISGRCSAQGLAVQQKSRAGEPQEGTCPAARYGELSEFTKEAGKSKHPAGGAGSLSNMNWSIVIPFFNEEDNVAPLLREVRAACPDAEIVAVD